MASTISFHPLSRPCPNIRPRPATPGSLARYHAVADAQTLGWTAQYRKQRLLGAGGQGVVYLGERQGTDGFTLPVALKFFSPRPYPDAAAYDEDMGRVARVAARVALIQHDNLLAIHDFFAQDGVRVMEMEWLDGYDLRRLMTPEVLDRTRGSVRPERWEYINRVVVTEGPSQPRFKPGVAIRVLRDCLAGLDALHREESSTATSSRPTSWSSAPATSNSSTSARPCARAGPPPAASGRRPTPPRKSSWARTTRPVRTSRAWDTFWWKCWPAGRRSRGWRR